MIMRRAFIVSLALHLFVGYLLIVHFKSESKNVIGNTKITAAYLYSGTLMLHKATRSIVPELKTALPKQQNQSLEKVQKFLPRNAKKAIVDASAKVVGSQDEAALLVHDWLQSHIKYPNSIPKNRREMKVYIGLVVFPDGSIKDVSILQSSGIVVLDQIIIADIAQIGLISAVISLIKEPRQFKVWIVFGGKLRIS